MSDTTKDLAEAPSHVPDVNTQEDSVRSPSFNVFRFRKLDDESQDFYDPATDIINILPQAIQNTMETLDSMLHDDPEYGIACDMAYNVHLAFQIRLIEQKDDINVVLSDFFKEFHQYPARFRAMFTEVLFTNLLVMWAVAQRRTSAGKSKKLVEPKDTMELGSIMTYLTPDTQAKVVREVTRVLTDSVKELRTEASDEPIGFVDEQNNVILSDAKDFVAKMIPIKDGPRAWSTISEILHNKDINNITDAAVHETYPEYIKRHD